MTADEHLAREAIRKTLAIATQAADARKADAYAGSFAPDGVLELGASADARYEGREAIRQWMLAPSAIPQPTGAVAGFVSHHLTTCRIDITTVSAAKVRTYWLVVTASGPDHSGYYDDAFTKIGEDWLIAHRRPRTLWFAPNSLVAPR